MKRILIITIIVILCVSCSKNTKQDDSLRGNKHNFLIFGDYGWVNKLSSNDSYASILGKSFPLSHIAVDKNGRFVAVGDGGSIQTSTDGDNWQTIDIGEFDLHFRAIAVNKNNTFVAIGTSVINIESQIVISSTDGLVWQLNKINSDIIQDVTSDNKGMFIAVGENGTILLSSDGNSWKKIKLEKNLSLKHVAVNPAGDIFAIGTREFKNQDGNILSNGVLLTSKDGTIWQKVTTPSFETSYSPDIAINKNGEILIAGDKNMLLSKDNGRSWIHVTKDSDPEAFMYTNCNDELCKKDVLRIGTLHHLTDLKDGGFVANTYDGKILHSKNGVDWYLESTRNNNDDYSFISGFAENKNGKIIAVGFHSILSSWGTGWTVINSANDSRLDSIQIDSLGNLVALSYDQNSKQQSLVVSKDGVTWTAKSNLPDKNSYRTFNAFAASNQGKYVAVGENGTVTVSNDITKSWNLIQTDVTDTLNQIAVNKKGEFVAVGSKGTILISKDGDNWQQVNSGTTNNLFDLAVNNEGLFVVVGKDGLILSSNDSVNWKVATTSNNSNDYYSVAVNNVGVFVAVGDNGAINTSQDGKLWLPVSSGTKMPLNKITTNSNGEFVAVGQLGTVLKSHDGKSWKTIKPINGISLYDIIAY